jgi:hypothetical protein
MTTQIHIEGVKEAMRAFSELPRRVGFKHLRIALNAGAGVIRDRYAAMVPRETGLLSKSIGVRVKIPDASYNKDHHGKPAYAVIGPKRKSGRFMRVNSLGNLKGYGEAQRALKAERLRIQKEGKITPLQRERAAVKSVKEKYTDGMYRNPSRYAHLAGPGRKGADVLNAAARQSKDAAAAKMAQKLQTGINAEAAALGRK